MVSAAGAEIVRIENVIRGTGVGDTGLKQEGDEGR